MLEYLFPRNLKRLNLSGPIFFQVHQLKTEKFAKFKIVFLILNYEKKLVAIKVTFKSHKIRMGVRHFSVFPPFNILVVIPLNFFGGSMSILRILC